MSISQIMCISHQPNVCWPNVLQLNVHLPNTRCPDVFDQNVFQLNVHCTNVFDPKAWHPRNGLRGIVLPWEEEDEHKQNEISFQGRGD
jgi:hypothetical protein